MGFLAMTLYINSSAQQKPTIKIDTYKTWTNVTDGGISNNGDYAYYITSNKPVGSSTFTIKSINGRWTKEFINVTNPIFTNDNKYLLGQLQNDTLFKLNLKTKQVDKLYDVKSYQIIKTQNVEKLMCYKKSSNDLFLSDDKQKRKVLVSNVFNYLISSDLNVLLVQQIDTAATYSLSLLNLTTGKNKVIYKGTKVSKMIFDDQGSQVAFIVNNRNLYEIWYYNNSLSQSKIIADTVKSSFDKLQIDDSYLQFAKDGESIFFNLKQDRNQPLDDVKSTLMLSNYKDREINVGSQLEKNNRSYFSILNIKSKKIIQLLKDTEQLIDESFKSETDSLFVIESMNASYHDLYVRNLKPANYYLCNTRTGERRIIEKDRSSLLQKISISKNRKYIVYYDQESGNYINYVVNTGKKINISHKIGESLIRNQLKDYIKPERFPVGINSWIENDEGLLINSAYDIWCVDPLGIKDPINLTLGSGNKNKIIYSILKQPDSPYLKWNTEAIVSTFNTQTKDYGYSGVLISKNPKLVKFSIDRTYVFPLEAQYFALEPNQFIKAKNSNVYLVKRETAKSAPNYYFSRNLKEFIPVSDNQPQKKYNWLFSELHNYKDSSGNNYQGILYKPENFDSTKRYPILFLYYEKFSNILNSFPSVDLPSANFSISTAVSNGYLVFLPDILIQPDRPGQGALQSVLAAVNHLAENKWADTSKMAIAGHSFGGFETNYIVTHCNQFKAAISGSGFSELISTIYDLWGSNSHMTKQGYFQYFSPKMQSSLIDAPSAYIENSPLLFGKNVTTPLLLMHNQEDQQVPVTQSRQFFLMLRSISKPVWWLNYKNEDHGISNENNALDYNTKVFEFLDHFLKGDKEPQWMADHS